MSKGFSVVGGQPVSGSDGLPAGLRKAGEQSEGTQGLLLEAVDEIAYLKRERAQYQDRIDELETVMRETWQRHRDALDCLVDTIRKLSTQTRNAIDTLTDPTVIEGMETTRTEIGRKVFKALGSTKEAAGGDTGTTEG
jgi:hypothetical protein